MGRTLITAPDEEPVSIGEAKLWLRAAQIDTPQDAAIASAITEEREYFESITERRLITQTWLETFDGFPLSSWDNRWSAIRPSLRPILTVTHIKYDDSSGAEQTVDPSVYLLRATSRPPEIALRVGQSWPSAQDGPDSVRVTMTVGYGADADAVPERAKKAILMLLAGKYHNRESNVTGTISTNPELERILNEFGSIPVA